jgi:hypothetical protein
MAGEGLRGFRGLVVAGGRWHTESHSAIVAGCVLQRSPLVRLGLSGSDVSLCLRGVPSSGCREPRGLAWRANTACQPLDSVGGHNDNGRRLRAEYSPHVGRQGGDAGLADRGQRSSRRHEPGGGRGALHKKESMSRPGTITQGGTCLGVRAPAPRPALRHGQGRSPTLLGARHGPGAFWPLPPRRAGGPSQSACGACAAGRCGVTSPFPGIPACVTSSGPAPSVGLQAITPTFIGMPGRSGPGGTQGPRP